MVGRGKIYTLLIIFLFINNEAFSFVKTSDAFLESTQKRVGDIDYSISDTNIDAYSKINLSVESLKNECIDRSKPVYVTINDFYSAKLNMMATIQYGTLSSIVKKLSYLYKILSFEKSEVNNLVENMVNNYCSENLTIISKKELKKNFIYFYDHLVFDKQEPIHGAHRDFLIKNINNEEYHKAQVDLLTKSFRSICSWNGKAQTPLLFQPFLTSPHIFISVFDQLTKRFDGFPPVVCEDFICRAKEMKNIQLIKFTSDAKDMYCFEFYNKKNEEDLSSTSVSDWASNQTSDDVAMQVLQTSSVITKQPNILLMADGKDSLKLISSNIEEFFQLYSDKLISTFKSLINYEETLTLKLHKANDFKDTIKKGKHNLNFEVVYGEYDKIQRFIGKPKASLQINLGEKFIDWVYRELTHNKRITRKKREHVKNVIKEQIKEILKSPYQNFFSFIDEDDFYEKVAKNIYLDIESVDEKQAKSHSGSYKANFYFGIFALGYIRLRNVIQN